VPDTNRRRQLTVKMWIPSDRTRAAESDVH